LPDVTPIQFHYQLTERSVIRAVFQQDIPHVSYCLSLLHKKFYDLISIGHHIAPKVGVRTPISILKKALSRIRIITPLILSLMLTPVRYGELFLTQEIFVFMLMTAESCINSQRSKFSAAVFALFHLHCICSSVLLSDEQTELSKHSPTYPYIIHEI
jgi:hypothetical protein